MDNEKREQFVTLETSKLLKQLGFDWEVGHYYSTKGPLEELNDDDVIYPAPTQEVAMKWLREKHNYFIWVTPVSKFKDYSNVVDSFVTYYNRYGKSALSRSIVHIPTYEEAIERGIQECLKVIIEWKGREV